MRMSDTAAVITGGASGLGEATARHFRENGAAVTIFDRDATRGHEVAEEIGHRVATRALLDQPGGGRQRTIGE